MRSCKLTTYLLTYAAKSGNDTTLARFYSCLFISCISNVIVFFTAQSITKCAVLAVVELSVCLSVRPSQYGSVTVVLRRRNMLLRCQGHIVYQFF